MRGGPAEAGGVTAPRHFLDLWRMDAASLRSILEDAKFRKARRAGLGQAVDRGRDLADRNWYPDIGVGVGVNQTDRGLDSYQAMVEVNLPLQWGLRRAQQAEATAMASGARQRLAQMDRQLEGDLAEDGLLLIAARDVAQERGSGDSRARVEHIDAAPGNRRQRRKARLGIVIQEVLGGLDPVVFPENPADRPYALIVGRAHPKFVALMRISLDVVPGGTR